MKRPTLGILLLAVAACGSGESAEAPAIQTVTPTQGDLRITAEATGTVEPIRRVEVKSKASGEILKLHADVGDEVQPGTLLAEVDPRDVQNAFDQANADLGVAKSRAEISKQQLERQKELLAAGVITQQELESATLDEANSQATLVKAQTNFDLAQLRMNDVTIRAPLAGTILERNVEEGTVIQSASQNVSGGSVLFVMATLEAMQVRTLVDETDMGELRAGMPSTVTVEAYPDRTFQGAVEKIEPQAEVQQNVTMFPVIVSLDNRNGLLKPGMNAEVEILIDQATDVMLVPNTAIVNMQDVGPAAMALGLDPDKIDMTQFQRRRPGARAGGDSAAAGAPGANPRLDSLRAKVQSGEISQDSLRAVMSSLRGQRGQGAPGQRGAGAGGFGARNGGAMASGAVPTMEPRPAAVFVVNAQGVPEPRMVTIGLNDWDNTQVVAGLNGDERLAVIGAAQLQAQQQEFLSRMRERSGGSPFGGRR